MTAAKPPEPPAAPPTAGVSEEGETPAPIHIEVTADEPNEGDYRQAAAARPGWQLGRSTPPSGSPVLNDRSGPIGIADGEFTTPTVRRRVTTQPRGISVIEPPKAPATDGVSLGQGQPPPTAPGEPAHAELDAEHVTLAAARRLAGQPDDFPTIEFDPGPTPPPLATPVPVTPPPQVLPATPPPRVTAPPRVMTPRPPLPQTAPPPSATHLAPPSSATATASGQPRAVDAATLAPLADSRPRVVDATPAPVPAAVSEPLPDIEDDTAVPSAPLQAGDSGANLSPLAQTLAHIAEAALHSDTGAESPVDVATDDDVELVDAPIGALKASSTAPPSIDRIPKRGATPPPLPATSTPPPIPGGRRAKTSAELLSALPEALAQRPRRLKRSKPWFEEVFDEDYLRTLPFMNPQQTLKEVAFIEQALQAPPGAELLDVGCGYGRHAIELVQRGLKVTGLDLSLPLLIRAADEAQRRAVAVNFVHADMREIAFEQQFDGAYCMLTSFGYFDEDANLRVAEGVARSLKPGGRFLLDVVNRDYLVGDLPTRIWWEGAGCVVLEEVDFNYHTSRIMTRRSVVFDDGRQLEQEISVRAYSLHEMGRLLRQAGFRVIDISGSTATPGHFFGSTSRNLLILSEKRSDDR